MGASNSSTKDHAHKHLQHATRRAHAHSAHYKLLEHDNAETQQLSRSAHNAFHDAMHETHELTAGRSHRHKRAGAGAEQTDGSAYDGDQMEQDLKNSQVASERWLVSYSEQINSGNGLRSHLVFGTEVPLDASESPASAQSILARYGQ